jgi:diguanylate cyclase (GGDEF)-like protein/PAS domain S-box-containing protein
MGTPLIKFPEAFLILDNKNHIIGLNQAGEELLNIMKADALGRSVDELFAHHSITVMDEEILPALGKEYGLKSSDGFSISIELKVSSIQGIESTIKGRILMIRDLDLPSQGDFLRNPYAILTAFQETAFDLHSTLDPDIVLRNIVERACKMLDTTNGYLYIWEEEADELKPVVGIGALEEVLGYKISKGEGVAGTVWQTGEPIIVSDYDTWPGRSSGFSYGTIRSVIGIPFLLKGRVVGVLGVAHSFDKEIVFTNEAVSVLSRFANMAAVALQNARLYGKAQREIEFRKSIEIELRDANQRLQFQVEHVELLQKQLKELAVRDTLTNLFNRRYLQEMLTVEFARSKRAHTSFAVLMMDSDQLKVVNDEYGHKAGDDFLVHIANVIRGSIRAGDIACRYGGDEFVVVLDNVAEKIAFARAEKLRKRIAEHYTLYKNIEVNISVSIGIAMFPAHGSTGEVLLQKADQALYQAKQKGKNCVVAYTDEGG